MNDFKKYTESTVEREIYTVKKELTLGGDYLIRKEEYNKYKDNKKEYTHGKDEYIKKVIALALKEKIE